MIEIYRKITIDSSCINENKEAEISLSNIYMKESHDISQNGVMNGIHVKNNDRIKLNIDIANTLKEQPIKDVKLIINDDDIFNFVHSSLRNTKTKEFYFCSDSRRNIFSLGSIIENEILPLSMFVKLNITKINAAKVKNAVEVLTQSDDEDSRQFMVHAKQSILKICNYAYKDKIEIENIGTAESKNIVYRYVVPRGFNVDMASIRYDVKNEKCIITAEKVNRNILFKINSVEPSDEKTKKMITINLKHIRTEMKLQNFEMKIN